MRYTPAGLPALNCTLEHASQQQEAGAQRAVALVIRAVAFGVDAERLARLPVGSSGQFKGFLANARQGKAVVFHIQDFLQD